MADPDQAGLPTPPLAVLPVLSGVDEVLAVVAHPDDESFGLGAILTSLAATGITVRLLCLTPGEASTLGAGADLATRRRGELRAAAARLGVTDPVLGEFADGALGEADTTRLRAAIESELGGAGALVVFEPSGVTGHPDHVAATLAAEAVAAAAGLPVLEWGVAGTVAQTLSSELGVSLHPLELPGRWPAELIVDRTPQRQAIACHVSQNPTNPLLSRRLVLEGDRELVRLRFAPYGARLARFVGQARPLVQPDASAPQRRRLLELLVGFASGGTWPLGVLNDDGDAGYGVHCLHEDGAGWTVATVVTERGGSTPPHDHAGWGAAVTVSGVERNARYRGSCPDRLEIIDEQLAPAGGGYLFGPDEVHQASDASGGRTVSVHLLSAPGPHPRQHCHERLSAGREEPGRELVAGQKESRQ
ncbi:MAG: hypothetical protein NVS3B18_05060 [Candidatus Dormibacteria bacterium]